MNGLTFNNRHSSEFGLVMRSINRQLLPQTKDEYVSVSQRDGAYLFDYAYEDRFIEVEFAFVENNLQAKQQIARNVSAWLSTRKRKILVFDDEADKEYHGKVANQIDLEPLIGAGRFTVIFRCFPFALSEEYTLTKTITNSSDVTTVEVDGTVQTPPIIMLRNISSNTVNGFTIIREVEVD